MPGRWPKACPGRRVVAGFEAEVWAVPLVSALATAHRWAGWPYTPRWRCRRKARASASSLASSWTVCMFVQST